MPAVTSPVHPTRSNLPKHQSSKVLQPLYARGNLHVRLMIPYLKFQINTVVQCKMHTTQGGYHVAPLWRICWPRSERKVAVFIKRSRHTAAADLSLDHRAISCIFTPPPAHFPMHDPEIYDSAFHNHWRLKVPDYSDYVATVSLWFHRPPQVTSSATVYQPQWQGTHSAIQGV